MFWEVKETLVESILQLVGVRILIQDIVVEAGSNAGVIIVFLFVLLFLSSKHGIPAERIGYNIRNTGFIMKFGGEFLNNHSPIQDTLGFDIAVN